MRPNGRWGLADYPLVVRVDSGSIADSVGMKVNDVIVTVNGRDTRDARAFDRRPGETGLVMRIRRGDEEKEIVIQFPPRGP
ncbi:MAG TPA: PDZ domain-containing protein [Longimicrobiaceae bacterium]